MTLIAFGIGVGFIAGAILTVAVLSQLALPDVVDDL